MVTQENWAMNKQLQVVQKWDFFGGKCISGFGLDIF